MKNTRFESWLMKIPETQDEEISCTECFELVSPYVEVELSGLEPSGKLVQVKQHLNHCPACREEYESLRDLQRLDNEGGAPSIDDLKDSIK